MKKELMIRLEKWCDDNDNQLVRYSIKDNVNSVVVYRHTGFSKDLIQIFKSNNELEKFLDESDERKKELNRYNEEIRKLMMEE